MKYSPLRAVSDQRIPNIRIALDTLFSTNFKTYGQDNTSREYAIIVSRNRQEHDVAFGISYVPQRMPEGLGDTTSNQEKDRSLDFDGSLISLLQGLSTSEAGGVSSGLERLSTAPSMEQACECICCYGGN